MRYPFLLPSLAYIAGIVLERLVCIPSAFCVSALFCFIPAAWLTRGTFLFRPVFLSAVIFISLINYRYLVLPPPNDISQITSEQETYGVIEGIVDDAVRSTKEGKSIRYFFPLRVESAKISDKIFPMRGKVQCSVYQAQEEIHLGDRVRLWGKISSPKRATNPGEFDYALYLSKRGIYRQVMAVGKKSCRIILPAQPGNPSAFVDRVRRFMAMRFDGLFNKTQSGLLKALTIGDRRDIPFRIQESFAHTGTVHVLSISGLHIVMVAGCWYAFWRIIGMPQRLNAAVTIAIVFFYMQIAGLNIPVVRSALMGALFYTAILIRREANSLNTLFLAAFVLLIIDPRWFFNISFQLSFLSVLSIIIFAPSFEKHLKSIRWSFLRRSMAVSSATMVGAQILVCFYFSTVTPISALANLIIVPLITVVTIGGFLIIGLSYIPYLGPASAYLLQATIRCSIFLNEQISRIPFAYWHVPKPSLTIIMVYYFFLAVFWFLTPWIERKRVYLPLAGVLMLITFFVGSSFEQAPSLSITALDVKQAGIFLIQTPDRRHILVNSGPSRKPDVGRWVTAPFLKSRGIRTLDGVILTGWGKRNWGALADLEYFFRIPYCFLPSQSRMPADFPRKLGGVEFKRMGSQTSIDGFDSIKLKSFSSSDGETALVVSWKENRALVVTSGSTKLWEKLERLSEKPNAVFIFMREPIFSSEMLSRIHDWAPSVIIVSGSVGEQIDPTFFPRSELILTKQVGATEVRFEENELKVKTYLDGLR